jgi:hypothetical protein
VVDDDVREHLDPRVVQRRDAVAQLGLGAVARVEVVEVAREVPLGADGVRGRGEPDAGEAGLSIVFISLAFSLFVCVCFVGLFVVGSRGFWGRGEERVVSLSAGRLKKRRTKESEREGANAATKRTQTQTQT